MTPRSVCAWVLKTESRWVSDLMELDVWGHLKEGLWVYLNRKSYSTLDGSD